MDIGSRIESETKVLLFFILSVVLLYQILGRESRHQSHNQGKVLRKGVLVDSLPHSVILTRNGYNLT